MKIAIALGADGVTLVHFGQADKFFIYDDAGGAFVMTESRPNSPPCGREDSQALMLAAARQISDCAAVVAACFGPCAVREVGNRGVYHFETEGVLDDRLLAGLARLRDYLLAGRSRNGRKSYE